MTVKIYAASDSNGQSWAPDHTHEVGGVIDILDRLWKALHHLPEMYAVIANLHDPSADLVVITERGMGIVELKHHFGKVTIDNAGIWYADRHPIRGGQYLSPHKQVQNYAEEIRNKIIALVPTQLKNNGFMVQTAVCFTNRDADLSKASKSANNPRVIERKPWESKFSIIAPENIARWVVGLRFGDTSNNGYQSAPFRLESEQIVYAMENLLGGRDWKEATALMPTGEPYGYLRMETADRIQPFPLSKDILTLGRDPECDIAIPREFKRTSRHHCEIRRKLTVAVIIDLESTRGTFVNGEQIWDETELEHGDIIQLGGLEDDKCCTLVFLDSKDFGSQLSMTEHTSLDEMEPLNSD